MTNPNNRKGERLDQSGRMFYSTITIKKITNPCKAYKDT